jgi:uncharacterized protein (TIGR00369 family)
MSSTPSTSLLSAVQVSHLVDEHFPQVHTGGKLLHIEEIGHRVARVRMLADPSQMRPGGTVSGPSMFKLADFSLWVVLLGVLGEHGLQAVTTNLNINFLSRPKPGDMVAHARIIKLGRRLAVGEIELYSEGIEDMVAHATGTYAIPPSTFAVS